MCNYMSERKFKTRVNPSLNTMNSYNFGNNYSITVENFHFLQQLPIHSETNIASFTRKDSEDLPPSYSRLNSIVCQPVPTITNFAPGVPPSYTQIAKSGILT